MNVVQCQCLNYDLGIVNFLEKATSLRDYNVDNSFTELNGAPKMKSVKFEISKYH